MGWAKTLGHRVLFQAKTHPWKTAGIAAGGIGAYHVAGLGWDLMFSGNGKSPVSKGVEKISKEGVLGVVKQVAVGTDNKDKSLGGYVTDELFGKGTSEKVHEVASGAYHKGKQLFGDDGGSDVAAMQQDMMIREGGGILDGFNGLGNSLGGIVNSITSSEGIQNIAALIPAAFLLFGGKGWMSKIAGLFLGLFVLRGMFSIPNQQSISHSLQLGQENNMRNQCLLDGGRDVDNARSVQEEEAQHVVRRSRGL